MLPSVVKVYSPKIFPVMDSDFPDRPPAFQQYGEPTSGYGGRTLYRLRRTDLAEDAKINVFLEGLLPGLLLRFGNRTWDSVRSCILEVVAWARQNPSTFM